MREDSPVPTHRGSAGDPARTLELLWRDPVVSRHGPRRGLSVDAIVAAATEIADAEALEAVTMRRVAEALRVSPMTLYTYVPGKAELLDLMLDAAYAQMSRADTSGQPWRERLTAIAEENMALLATHPWVATVSTARPTLGPGSMAKYEHELRALQDLGLDDIETDAALTFLLSFVQSCGRAAADVRGTEQHTAMDDAQWWATNAPLLARVLDEGAYPIAARVGTAAGTAHAGAYNPRYAYTFGLQRVLDGLAALIDTRHRDQADPAR
jgi:AcrR family transcriptional regulator